MLREASCRGSRAAGCSTLTCSAMLPMMAAMTHGLPFKMRGVRDELMTNLHYMVQVTNNASGSRLWPKRRKTDFVGARGHVPAVERVEALRRDERGHGDRTSAGRVAAIDDLPLVVADCSRWM